MFRRPRQRRGPYSLASTTPVPAGMLRFIVLATIALVLFVGGRWVLRSMGIGNNVQRAAALLVVDDGAQTSVALDGGGLTRAEDTLKLYSGDRVVSTSGRFSLLFFDGTLLRADAGTDLTVRDSSRGAQVSTVDIRLAKGSLWLQTPTAEVFTGSIIRMLQTPSFSASVPSGAEAVFGEQSIAVFDADGLGVSLDIDGNETAYVGEGQELTLPADGEWGDDVYAFRNAVTASTLGNPFVLNSRQVATRGQGNVSAGIADPVPSSSEVLTITTPENDAVITTRTVRVTGTVGDSVRRIRVNGYQATLDTARRTFSQELALGDSEETEIRVEALDERGLTLQELRRTVRRDIQPPPSPAITQPAPNGTVFRTSREEFEVRGTAPPGVAGIIVNDYRLQLFQKGNTEWSYLASVRLGNAVRGANTFEVVSIDDANNRSEPVYLTIRIEEGEEGIIGETGSATSAAASSASSINITQLPTNDPLQPGSVAVTAPAPGTSATMTGTELLLEGTSPASAASLWVNDYKLQLFNPAKQSWTYIAREEWGTLKAGVNTFIVIARDADDKIIDKVTYTVTRE